MARIFMSHSKHDKRGREFFDRVISATNHKAFWYSYEGPALPHGPSIRDAIKDRNTVAMFVLLSPEMETIHTIAWVGYEVGLAIALGLDVLVFEHEDGRPVNVPVPFVDAYLQYPTKLERKDEGPFHSLVNFLCTRKRRVRKKSFDIITEHCSQFECYHDNCRASYLGYFRKEKRRSISFSCPVCRQPLEYGDSAANDEYKVGYEFDRIIGG